MRPKNLSSRDTRTETHRMVRDRVVRDRTRTREKNENLGPIRTEWSGDKAVRGSLLFSAYVVHGSFSTYAPSGKVILDITLIF